MQQPRWLRDRIANEVEGNKKLGIKGDTALGIIADLANCTKHLVLTGPIFEDAALSGTTATVNTADRTMTSREVNVRLKDGTTHSGLDFLHDAHRPWDDLLRRHGLL